MKNKYLIFLSLIVLLGAILRLFSLSSYPPSLNWDEASHGYNAFSILKTGKDQWGQVLPIFNFRAYGDYPLPLNLYLTMPFIAALGLNEFSIRLPHAILGIGTIIATYFLATGLTKRKEIGLVASLLVAIDPWTLFASRSVLQSNLSVFFLTLSGALFFNRENKKYFIPLSIVSLGLTLYSYHSTRILSPLILLAAVIIYWKNIKLTWISITLAVIFFLPLPYIFLNPSSRARSDVVFILNDAAVNKIISLRQNSKMPELVSKIAYNRPTYFAWSFVNNYFDYFSPEFLFFKGGTQYQFSVPNFGVLQFASLPFFYIGLIWLGKNLKEKGEHQLLAAWLLLAPIPAAITVDRFAVIRSSSMVPIPEILSAIGLFLVLDFIAKKKKTLVLKPVILTLFLIILAFGLEKYISTYIGDYNSKYSWSWQYGYKEAVNYSLNNYDKYDKIIITKKYGEPHEFFLFYWSWNPDKYLNDKSAVRFFQSNWYWVDHFDKFWFVNDWQVKELVTESKIKIDCRNVKCLLITSPGNYPDDWVKIKEARFLDGQTAFEFYEN